MIKVGFQIVVKVMGFSYVFENGSKCNSPWMSVSFSFLCLTRFQWKVNFFVGEVSFDQLLKVMGFTYV